MRTSSQKLQGGTLRRCPVDIFSERASLSRWIYGVKNGMQNISIAEVTYLLSVRLAAFRRHSLSRFSGKLYLGLFTELGNLYIDVRLHKATAEGFADSQREMRNKLNLEAEYRCNIQGQTNP